MMSGRAGVVQRASASRRVQRFQDGRLRAVEDAIVIEEPLEVWLQKGTRRHRWGTTMRTPGHDDELAAGVLFSEAILADRADIRDLGHVPFPGDEQEFNSVRVRLSAKAKWKVQGAGPRRVTSACGVCGRQTIDDLREQCAPNTGGFTISGKVLAGLPQGLRRHQAVFASTGGLHAAALVDARGTFHLVREDIGRHNAVDKVVGRSLLEGGLPLVDRILFVSGRAGFEIVQKAARAQIPAVAAVGAPSSLAVDVAQEFGILLAAFVRDGRFNVYAGARRLRAPAR